MQVKYITIPLITLALVGCSQNTPRGPMSSIPSPIRTSLGPPTSEEVTKLTELAKTSLVRITTNRGRIDLELYPDDAPIHVANFLKLIQSGFYDGLTFHRVEPGFVIQGGDPNGNGTGGPGYSINAEFNSRPHLLGTLAMARSNDPNSAGSQFYITLAPQPMLDGKYTVFGGVVAGMEVVKQITVGDVMDKVEIIPRQATP